jgi:hypothetical protein
VSLANEPPLLLDEPPLLLDEPLLLLRKPPLLLIFPFLVSTALSGTMGFHASPVLLSPSWSTNTIGAAILTPLRGEWRQKKRLNILFDAAKFALLCV